MADVLVCIKRVPEISGQVALSDDEQSVDARHVGFTVSAHDACAVELATQVAGATGGNATVLTVGQEDATPQLRDALAVGCARAIRVDAPTETYGPADVAAAISQVVRTNETEGSTYDLILLGNDAADTGDFQVGVRLAYALDRPVVTGIKMVTVADGVVVAQGDGPNAIEVFELSLPAVVAVMEGGVEPRYPSVPGRMKAKRATIETVEAGVRPVGSGRVRLKLPPEKPSLVEILGAGEAAAPALVDVLVKAGVVPG